MSYRPQPIDTTGIELESELNELVERLAESNHDHWAIGRINEGWSYGPKRDDEHKKHPDLRPYGELSDSEKEYDRVSVTETLKAIVALGYTISRAG
jgi:hypothetical protein